MIFVALPWSGSGVDGYIVHVDHYTPFVNEVSEYCVHHGLEGGGRVGQAKEHDHGFVKAFVGDECCLPAIFWFDKHFVVPPFDVKAGEQGTVSQAVD